MPALGAPGAGIRLRRGKDGFDKKYIYMRGEFGQVLLGSDDTLGYSMTLVADWRGTGVMAITGAPGCSATGVRSPCSAF